MRIVLIGFMGSGKTSVAEKLSDKLGLKMIDMDELILKNSGLKTINEIFKENGEKEFRKMEENKAQDLVTEDNVVISTGGGVVINKKTIGFLARNSKIVYLKTNFENAKKRVYMKTLRPPLFQNLKSAKSLFDKRKSLYLSYSDIVIDTNNKGLYEVVGNIIVELERE